MQAHKEALAAELAHARRLHLPYVHIQEALRRHNTALMRAELEARQ